MSPLVPPLVPLLFATPAVTAKVASKAASFAKLVRAAEVAEGLGEAVAVGAESADGVAAAGETAAGIGGEVLEEIGAAAPTAVPSIRVNTSANAANQTIGELLPGLSDDSMIHLSPEAAESFVQGVHPDSYFARYGDVKNLTVGRFKGDVVLPGAPAFETEAATFVIKKQPSPGMFGPAPEGAGEYLNKGLLVPDEIVKVPPIPPKTRF